MKRTDDILNKIEDLRERFPHSWACTEKVCVCLNKPAHEAFDELRAFLLEGITK